MKASIETMLESFGLGMERDRSRRPRWDEKILLGDIWNNGMPFEQLRDEIVRRLRASTWIERNDAIEELVDELADTDTEGWFNEVWSQLYDEADTFGEWRVWLDVWSVPKTVQS